MIYYLFLPVFSLLLLTLQVTFFNIFPLGKFFPDMSLILVIYAGFYLSLTRGGVLSVVLGFIMDCITGFMPGFFILNYMLVFMISNLAAFRLYAGGMIFVASFTVLCVLIEKAMIVLTYAVLYDVSVFFDVFDISLLQAFVTGVFAPAFFALFNKIEVFLSVWESKTPNQL